MSLASDIVRMCEDDQTVKCVKDVSGKECGGDIVDGKCTKCDAKPDEKVDDKPAEVPAGESFAAHLMKMFEELEAPHFAAKRSEVAAVFDSITKTPDAAQKAKIYEGLAAAAAQVPVIADLIEHHKMMNSAKTPEEAVTHQKSFFSKLESIPEANLGDKGMTGQTKTPLAS